MTYFHAVTAVGHSSNESAPNSKADLDELSRIGQITVYGTHPDLFNTDDDGLDDLAEINAATNPLPSDTDEGSTPDAPSPIRTAVKFHFNAANGGSYQIETSSDFIEWTTVETDIIGQSAVVTRFYSIENQPNCFFRVRKN